MGSFFKKLIVSKDGKAVRDMLDFFYFPPLSRGHGHVPLKSIDDDTRTKVLLFTYGAYDAYCQANRISNDMALQISFELDKFVQRALGVSFSGFLKTDVYMSARDTPDLFKVIGMGRQNYGEFASKEENRWLKSGIKLVFLVDEWTQEMLFTEAFPEVGKAYSSGQIDLRTMFDRFHQLSLKWKTGEDLPLPANKKQKNSLGSFDRLKRPKEVHVVLELLDEADHKFDCPRAVQR